MKGYHQLRTNYFSTILNTKLFMLLLIALFVAILSICISLSIGSTNIPITDVVKSLIGISSPTNQLIIKTLRLPRTLVAFLVGSSLALSGAILQGIIKNPLASPNIIGIVNGGSMGALVFFNIFLEIKTNSLRVSIFYMPLFAFLGAITISLLIFIIAYNKGLSPFRFILVGIGLSGVANGITTLLIIKGPPILAHEFHIWLMGTIYGTNWIHVKILLIWFLFFGFLSLIASRELNLQNLNDDLVLSLGSNKKGRTFILLILSTALASGAVAIGGGIGFVGLLSPHIARKLTDSSFENLLPLSVVIGGIIVVMADLVARTIMSPLDLPVGIFTAIIGAPFFIYLLLQYNK